MFHWLHWRTKRRQVACPPFVCDCLCSLNCFQAVFIALMVWICVAQSLAWCCLNCLQFWVIINPYYSTVAIYVICWFKCLVYTSAKWFVIYFISYSTVQVHWDHYYYWVMPSNRAAVYIYAFRFSTANVWSVRVAICEWKMENSLFSVFLLFLHCSLFLFIIYFRYTWYHSYSNKLLLFIILMNSIFYLSVF